jgi:hypothetical protein
MPALGRRNGALVAAIFVLASLVVVPSVQAIGASSLSAWSAATAPLPVGNWYAVSYANGQWVALGDTAEVAVSNDAMSWVEDPAPSGSWHSLAYGDGKFVALSSTSAGDEEMVSTNGTDWTTVTGPSGPWTDLTFGGGRFVAVSSAGQIVVSVDGEHWTEEWHHSNYDLTSVTYGGGEFVAVDAALGATVISSSGSSWSRILPKKSGLEWGAVAYGNGNFVALDGAGPDAGFYETSVYGSIWTLHTLSPAQPIDAATFGCGSFIAVGQSADSPGSFLSSPTGATWSTSVAPLNSGGTWTAVGYGGHRYVAVDSAGDIAWSNTTADCAAAIPNAPQQVSGNVRNGQVWTYMHPPSSGGGAPVDGYRVTISDGTVTRQCGAKVYFEPNCIIRGLRNHHVYWVMAQAHNRFGFSVSADPEFVIPVASWTFSAVTESAVLSRSAPVVVQVTGVQANNEGIYPTSVVTIHFGALTAYCHPNPFGECLVSIAHPPLGAAEIYATYTGYGRSYRSPSFLATVTP